MEVGPELVEHFRKDTNRAPGWERSSIR